MKTGKPAKRYQTTAAGLHDLQRHLEKLCRQREQLTEELRDLVSQNDVSNVMYDYAQTVSHSQVNEIEHEISRLKRILSGAIVVTPPADRVGIGSTVSLNIGGTLRTFTIVGNMEADPLNCKISDECPFGQALMGKKAGDRVVLNLHLGKTQTAVITKITAG